LEITRATLCNWTIGVYERYLPLFSFYKNILLSGRLLGIDETVLQVHREDGRSDTTNSYMWVIRGGTVERPILLYMYRETRSANFLKKYLKWYNGIIQTDGYTSYDAHFRGNENILHAGCLAHARREFEKFWKANKNPIAGNILNQIRGLYKIEDEIRNPEYSKGIELSERLRLREPQNLKNILNLVDLYSLNQNPRRAEELLQFYLKLDPENQSALDMMQVIKRRKAN
jgi:transposase